MTGNRLSGSVTVFQYATSSLQHCCAGWATRSNTCRSNTEVTSPDSLLRHEVFILNSLLSSAAFLECTINELYADAADDACSFGDEKKEALLRTIREKWNNRKNFDRAPLITRYQKILGIAKKPSFDETNPVFSDIRHLVEIRNYLMHYKREWVTVHERRRGMEQ